MNVAIHTESKVWSSDHVKERIVRAVAAVSYGVGRLMPVLHRGRIIAWCGWSFIERAPIVVMHRGWMRKWIDRDGLFCGFNSVDDLIYQSTVNGQMRQLFWFKSHVTASTSSVWNHFYGLAGFPGRGTFTGTAFTARRHDDTEVGALMHGGNVSPKTKHIISHWIRSGATATNDTHIACLYDMVISYDQCTLTTVLNNFTNTNTALRYISAGDYGLQIMGCVNSATTASNAYTLKYTSIGGTAGRSIPGAVIATPFSSPTPDSGYAASTAFAQDVSGSLFTMLNVPLVNGDSGVKQLDSVQMGSIAAESVNYILGYQLAWMPIYSGNDYTYTMDLVKQAPSLPRIRDGACLALAIHTVGGQSVTWNGGVNVAWG